MVEAGPAMQEPKPPSRNAFTLFFDEKREEFKNMGGGDSRQAMSLASKAWKELLEQGQEPYQKRWKELKMNYVKQVAEFQAEGGQLSKKKKKKTEKTPETKAATPSLGARGRGRGRAKVVTADVSGPPSPGARSRGRGRAKVVTEDVSRNSSPGARGRGRGRAKVVAEDEAAKASEKTLDGAEAAAKEEAYKKRKKERVEADEDDRKTKKDREADKDKSDDDDDSEEEPHCDKESTTKRREPKEEAAGKDDRKTKKDREADKDKSDDDDDSEAAKSQGVQRKLARDTTAKRSSIGSASSNSGGSTVRPVLKAPPAKKAKKVSKPVAEEPLASDSATPAPQEEGSLPVTAPETTPPSGAAQSSVGNASGSTDPAIGSEEGAPPAADSESRAAALPVDTTRRPEAPHATRRPLRSFSNDALCAEVGRRLVDGSGFAAELMSRVGGD